MQQFLLNTEMETKVTEEVAEDSDLASRILQAGLQWNGSDYTTGRCATTLYNATGVSLVTAKFADYLGAHLFELFLLWGLEVLQLELPDRASEAAFQLVQIYQTGGKPLQNVPQDMVMDIQPNQEEGEDKEDIEGDITK